jgi:paraquat-inducible protein B
MIGLFLIGAVVLAVVGVATLASATWFSPQSTFISFFQESVNGLEPGAAVKFQGAPVGRVTEIMIQIDERGKTFRVPVRYDIDLTRLTTSTGAFVDLDEELVLRQQIADGLRAQLQMESIVTGQLYLELSYNVEARPAEFEAGPTPYPEIPTSPSLLAAIGTGAGSLVADVLKILFRVNELLEGVDMQGINAAVVASAQSVQRLVESPEILAAMSQVPGMTTQVSETMEELKRLAERMGAGMDPMQSQLEETSREMVLTLQALRKSIDETHEMLTADSGVGYRLEQALASFAEAAEAMRVLAVTLERNPDMLLRGKKPGGERP